MHSFTLNKEQKAVVTHDTGPLLVIAGAGTGKTRVLTQRVIHLVESGKASPAEILGLTFTEKATQEMQERIDMGLPIGYEELWIKTFHGFCEAVLRERGLEIGLDTGYRVMSDAEQWLFLKKHLFDFDFDYFRPLGNPTKFLRALLQHFGRLRDEDITPEAYATFKPGPEEVDRHKELADAYTKYQELKITENVMDYADLHYYTLRLFEKRPQILKEYQERFTYIMVDEFQDTNYAQNKIVELMAQGHGNIMVVGDDDQCLYRWRGASVANIMNFEKTFPRAKKIVLTQNYRSNQTILDASYHLIQNNNPDRLEVQEQLSKKLKGSKAEGGAVSTHAFAHYFEEVGFTVGEIEDALQAEKSVAILVRAAAHAEPFIDELKRRSIPYHFSGGAGLFVREEIKDLIALLKFVANPQDDIALFRLLMLPLFALQMPLVLQSVHTAKYHHASLFATLKQGVVFTHVTKMLSELIDFSQRHSVSRVVQEFFEQSGYFKELLDNETAENHEKILNISEFSKKVRDFEHEDETRSVVQFVQYLDSLREAGENPRAELIDIDESTVQIMTIHAAKGLEFDAVFLVNLVKGRFPTINRKDPIAIPEELIAEDLPTNDQHMSEERRLFYVACTRARERLFLTHSAKYEGAKSWKISPFVDEIVGSGKVAEFAINPAHIEGPVATETRAHRSIHTFKPKKLSYSQLDTWKMCPLKYKYRYIYKLPSPSAHAANFGASVHDTLNSFYQSLKDGKKPTLDLLNDAYDENWVPYGYESKAHENARKKKGREILRNFYETNSDPWVKPAFLERPFSLKIPAPALEGVVTVAGRIDRIDKLKDGTYEVIDYKTGKLRRQSDIDKDLQLSIYARACRDVLGLVVSKLSFYFLEDNEKISTERTPEQLDAVSEEIAGECEKLSVSEFDPTPGFHCNFCEYSLLCPAAPK